MKSTDERIEDVFVRARVREASARRRRQRAVALGGGVLSVLLVVFAGIGVSSAVWPSALSGSENIPGLMGSVVANGSALGYIVVGLLGVVLGMAITVLVYKLGQSPSRKAHAGDKGRKP